LHLDQFYWQPNWVETEKTIWTKKVVELSNKSEWIIDGNYGGTLDIRIQRADTIIYLDIPIVKCLYRITKRIVKYNGKVRPDMPVGCKERFDLEFYHYVLTFNKRKRKGILSKLDKVKYEKQVYTLKSDTQTRKFISSLDRK